MVYALPTTLQGEITVPISDVPPDPQEEKISTTLIPTHYDQRPELPLSRQDADMLGTYIANDLAIRKLAKLLGDEKGKTTFDQFTLGVFKDAKDHIEIKSAKLYGWQWVQSMENPGTNSYAKLYEVFVNRVCEIRAISRSP